MNEKRTRLFAACAFIAYSAMLIRLVVFKVIPIIRIGHLRLRFAGYHTGPSNFIPFKSIVPELIGRGNHLINVVNLLGNIIPFIPIGLLAPLVFQFTSWQKALAVGGVIGLSFEVMELVFRIGIFDVDDVILNAFGVTVGYEVWIMFNRRVQSRLA